ncbi:ABC transporter permease [Halobacteriaceae archaeon GCM10025711]
MIPRGIARRFPAAMMADRNLTRTKVRSALAGLGILIGVIAIASLGMLGSTIQYSATSSLGTIGNEVIVSPAFQSGVQELNERDLREIQRAAGDAVVVPIQQDQAVVSYGGSQQVVTVYGMENPADAFDARSGRVPDPFRSGALVGATVADQLELREGNSLVLGNRTVRVKAVLAQESGFTPLNPNNAVVVPAGSLDQTGYNQVLVVAESGETANESSAAIREALNRRTDRVSVFELSSITAQIGSFFDTLNLFLLGIGSISLLVAGVSILNVMLMSTVERRAEIGVLRAVGFQKREVLRILLTEATLLGVIGGVAGLLVSLGIGLLLAAVTVGDPLFVLQPGNLVYLLVAFGFGVVTSILSGFYPAWKAANERPVDALRN